MKINEQEYNKIIAKNLKRIIYQSGKTQAEVAEDLHINKSTLSCWMTGRRAPRMQSLDILCQYFNVRRSDIMEEQTEELTRDKLSPIEQRLLESFATLNEEGQELILKQTEGLAASGLYNIYGESELVEKEA